MTLHPLPLRKSQETKPFSVTDVTSNFEREPLAQPFGFKGSTISQVWQVVSRLKGAEGFSRTGLGVQNPLWSDASVAGKYSESGGNALMYAITEYALQLIKGQSFATPIHMVEDILEEVMVYARKITGNDSLRTTFALNALVSIDNAAWLLYSDTNSIDDFDNMVPNPYRKGLSARHDKVVAIPALGYGTPMDKIKMLADEGFFIMKIKIGAPGTQKEMLEKDKAFLKAIHETIGHYETPYSPNGKLPYYFDANGRYDQQDTLMEFLDYADKIGAVDQIAVLEEPFGERNQKDVHQITARGPLVAADESAHTDLETIERIEQGYNAIAVKAVAKTMSMTMKIAQVAFDRNVPCFCADLTVNPILVDWNKVVAARLPAFPGWNMGMQETNGWQNYRDWDKMQTYHPLPDAPWIKPDKGVYHTGEDFMKKSGGIFKSSQHYEDLFVELK